MSMLNKVRRNPMPLALLAIIGVLLIARGIPGKQCPGANPVIDLWVDRHRLRVEVASTASARQCGLSLRDHLPPDSGMLFVFPQAAVQHFWMRDTRFPLDLAFVDAEGVIASIVTMSPAGPERIHSSPSAVSLAIETHAHWFGERAISPGALATFELPADLTVN
jgi:uncharacterized membrane protein (UPF0127 family)